MITTFYSHEQRKAIESELNEQFNRRQWVCRDAFKKSLFL